MTSRTVTAVLKAEASQYLSGMKQAEAAAKATGNATKAAGTAAAAGTKQMGSAASTAASANQKMGASATQAADATGKLGAAASTGAAATDKVGSAAQKAGTALKGTVGDVDKFGNALTEADVAAGRYVNAGGRVAEANGQMAAGFGKARDAAEQAGDSADEAATGWQKLSQNALQNEQAWSTVSTTLLGVGAAAVAGVGLAIKTYADFDKAMSSVQAATHASAGEMDALREAAVRAGADTAFSAEEAAQGIEELAKAGVSTSDILGGGLDGALALAAAGSLEVGDAAEIAASALTQFKLEGSDVGHIADLLAAGAGKAQGSVHDLGMALNQSGLVAAQTGLTIEEATGGLAAFASAGLVGSDAGTSFKTMLQRLNPQSDAAATLMDELGISAYDSEGSFIGLTEWAGKLQSGLSGMSEQQRAAAMQTLFGSDAVRAASVVYEQGADGIQKWIDNVNDAGYAAETAALMQDNLAGDLEKLGGAIDTVFLKAGSGPNDFLRNIVQGAESAVDAVGKVPAPVLSTGAAITGIAGAAAIGVGGFMKLVSMTAETKAAMDTLGISSDQVKGKLGAVGKAAGVAMVAVAGFELAKWAGAQGQPAVQTLEDVEAAMTGVGRAANDLDLDAVFADLSEGAIGSGMEIRNLDDALELKHAGGFRGAMLGIGESLGVENELAHVNAAFAGIDQVLSDMVSSGNADAAAVNFKKIADAAAAQGIPLEELQQSFPQYANALSAAAEASTGAATGMDHIASSAVGAGEGVAQLEQGMGQIVDSSGEAVESLGDLVEAMSLLGMIELDAQAATGAFHESLRAATEAAGELSGVMTGAGDAFNVTTEAGYEAQQAFAGVAEAGWDMAEGVANAGGSFTEITGSLQSTYDGLVSTAQGFGFTSEAANALAREALGIPENVDIETWMSNSALQMALQTGSVAGDIPGQVSIGSYMSDAAFREALRTRAAALDIPEHEAISSFMDSMAANKADETTAKILGIPKGASVSSWMDSSARSEAESLRAAINAVDGRHSQSQHTHTVVTNEVWNRSSVGKAAGPGSRGALRPGLYTGGRVPGLATGGRLPQYGPGTDRRDGIMGISSLTGEPTAWVDKGEWVINGRSSQKYDGLLAAINRDDPRLSGLPAFAGGGRIAGRLDGLSARPGEENWQWQARQLEIIKSMEYTVGKLADWELYEDGSGWVRTMDGAMVEIADGAYTVTYAAGDASRNMGLASQDAKWAAETAKAAGGSFQGAGVSANAAAGTFQVAGQVTQQAAQAILAATAAVNAAGKQRKAATGGGLRAQAGETNAVWRGRHDQFEQAIAKKYGGVKYSDLHEDGSGQMVLDDGRLIELDDGRWKFVSRFKYGPPARGRTVSRYASGGRLPSTGMGSDSILGVSSAGTPVAWVDDREWVINQRSSDKYNALLSAVNRDDPSVRHLARHAAGARAGSREYAAAPVGAFAAPAAAPAVSPQELRAAVAQGTSDGIAQWRPAWQISDRQFYGSMQRAERQMKRN